MQQEIDFWRLMRQIEQRRLALGITEADDAVRGNSGSRRTPEKRQLLREIAERCKAAGIKPVPANFQKFPANF
jgi:hypothetical protein